MGYFSNSTDGMIFENEHCSSCVHELNCVVMFAHMLFAYELCNDKDNPGKQILDLLIPMDEKGNNEACEMYAEKKTAYKPETTTPLF